MLRFFVLLFVSAELGNKCLPAEAGRLNKNANTSDVSQKILSYEKTVCPSTEIKEIEEAPYFVRLCTPRACFCAGTILSDRWIVTTGHCVYKNTNFINVYSGHTSSRRADEHAVVHTVLHPRFGVRHGFLKIRNNIAMLYVNPPFKFSETTAKISIAIHPPIEGVTYPVFSMGNGTIRKNSVTVLPHQECKTVKKVPGHTYCSAGCHMATDSETGGPMIDNHEVLGITSFGESPQRSTFAPGVVFVQLCDYIQWIEEVVTNFPEINEEKTKIRVAAQDP